MEKLAHLSILFVFVLSFSTAHSASVKVVKGKQALINTDGSNFKVGQELMAKDAQGKNRAILKITKLGKAQALAEILKGKAEVGYSIAARRPASIDGSSTTGSSSFSRGVSGKKMGVLGTYLNNTMNARFSLDSVNYTASMSGTGLGVLGYYDMPIAKDFELRGMGGLEQFIAKESKTAAVCDAGTSTNCNVNITYLSMYGMVKYKFIKGKTNYWGGGGLGYLLAASKSSTVLNTSQISTNQVFTLSAGMDMGLSGNTILPISLDYSLFPSSGTVSASMIALRVGWGWGK